MTKLAIIQNGDEPQVMSTAAMLKCAGYQIKVCGTQLRNELGRVGLDTVLSVQHMQALGYDPLPSSIGEASLADMDRCDLFLEIKVRNIPKLWTRWPRLEGRTAYLRVNGAQPEICSKGGDEVNLPCPIITACLWYGTERYRQKDDRSAQGQSTLEHLANQPAVDPGPVALGDNGRAYVCWPPYAGRAEYDAIDRTSLIGYNPPYCMAHSARAWGYGEIIDDCVRLGVKVHGNNAPAGQVSHRQVPEIAATALALVHLKSVDCPGWALYEALLAGCPVVTGRLLNSRMLAYDLLVHGETCYEFGVPASLEYGRGDMAFAKCLEDIKTALAELSDPEENRRIGEAGRNRLNELIWREDRDGDSFRTFMQRNYG